MWGADSVIPTSWLRRTGFGIERGPRRRRRPARRPIRPSATARRPPLTRRPRLQATWTGYGAGASSTHRLQEFLGVRAQDERLDDLPDADDDQPNSAKDGEREDGVQRREDDDHTADGQDDAAEDLPASVGQVRRGSGRDSTGYSDDQPAEADPQCQEQNRLRRTAEADQAEQDGQRTGEDPEESNRASLLWRERQDDLEYAADEQVDCEQHSYDAHCLTRPDEHDDAHDDSDYAQAQQPQPPPMGNALKHGFRDTCFSLIRHAP